MIYESILEDLSVGKIYEALDKAKSAGLSELANNIEMSWLRDKKKYTLHYEQDNGRIPGWQVNQGWQLDRRQHCALEHIKQIKSDSLLDIGCADGSFIFNCLHANVIKKGVGIDLWKEGISWAKEFGKVNFPTQTMFIQGLFEDFSEMLTEFKAIHIGEVLEHVLDPIDLLTRAKKLLTLDGGIVITVPVKRPPLNQDEIKTLTNGTVNEHVRYIDLTEIEKYADLCDLKILKYQYEDSPWVNLVTTLIKK